MSLRIALVIDGETQGSAKALKETEDGIKKLTSAASDASGEFDDISEKLAETATSATSAASDVDKIGTAATGVGTKFNDMKSLAIGALGGIAGAFGVALVTGAIGTATNAFIHFVKNIVSAGPAIETALNEQKQLFQQFKDAIAEAEGGPSSFGLNSEEVIEANIQSTIRAGVEAYEKELSQVSQAVNILSNSGNVGPFGMLVGEVEGSPYQDASEKFIADIKIGVGNVIEYRNVISDIYRKLENDSPFKGPGERILNATTQAAELQSKLVKTAAAYQGISGNSEALVAAFGKSAEGFDAVGLSASSANDFLAQHLVLLNAISRGSEFQPITSPVYGPVQPHALGGVVTQPTLFNFGAGEVGLMGEAGDEAILPMTGGKVGALGTLGQEFRLGVTRLQSGEMGVQMPQAFALGGVVGGSVKKFASGGVVSSSAGSLFSGGFGQIGNQISNLISELFTGGQVTDFGGLMADQMAHESNIRDQLIAQSPERIAALEAESAAIGNVTDEIEDQSGWLETGKSVWRNFFVEIGQATADGIITADEWGNAISGALDTLRDKAFALAADGIFDLIAGAFSGGFGGGGGNFFGDIIGGLFGFSDGGWTGDGPGTKGVVHGDEFVVRAGPAAANRSVLEAMNSGASFGGAGGGGGVTFAPVTHIDARGSNMSETQFNRILDQRDKVTQAKFGQFFAEQTRRAVPGVV